MLCIEAEEPAVIHERRNCSVLPFANYSISITFPFVFTTDSIGWSSRADSDSGFSSGNGNRYRMLRFAIGRTVIQIGRKRA